MIHRGHQTIGPFMNFTSVIGPNGLSFVLGVKSVQLRSSQMRDLVYRGRPEVASTVRQQKERRKMERERERVLRNRLRLRPCSLTKIKRNGCFSERRSPVDIERSDASF